MRGYLVDTNIPSEFTRDQPDARVVQFIREAGQENLFLTVMALGEIRKGIDLLPISQKRTGLQDWLDIDVRAWFAGRILPVTEVIAQRWGQLAAAQKQGVTLAVVDGVIAATALEHDLTLVTRKHEAFHDARRHPDKSMGIKVRQAPRRYINKAGDNTSE
ncbi:MAG TPA: type II toxin-antitoxin system VapC family toxin [Bryobacteraceae bacterium]